MLLVALREMERGDEKPVAKMRLVRVVPAPAETM
jgi:hypothetical protein